MDLIKLFTIIQNDKDQLNELRDKHVVLLFGTTGTGKSTIANSII